MNETEVFISRAKAVHGDKYDYSKTTYVKSKSKVTIICPDHGEFQQIPNSHLNGSGCFYCGSIKRHESKKLKLGDAIQKCIDTHGSKYDYSKVKYNFVTDTVDIVCKSHGLFSQILINHYRGQGCPKCGKESMSEKQKMEPSEFLKRSRLLHGDRYEYELSDFENYRSKVNITCKKHGRFSQVAEAHYSLGAGCPSCAVRFSAAETEICEMLDSLGVEYFKGDRTILKPLEVDILIPSYSLAIEYNGLKWHSDEFSKDRNYHLDKTENARKKGYRLIHLWENDWNENKELQLRFIKHQLGITGLKIYGRKCRVETSVSKEVVNQFLDKFHVQGRCVFTYSVCLFYHDELVTVTCFTKRNNQYELVRHCNSVHVVGSLGKTVKYFLRLTKKEIFTFLDKSRFSGESYLKAGFEILEVQKPDYSYVKNSKRYHKFLFRKKCIKTKLPEFYDEKLTERQMMKNAGYQRLWDCGKIKYIITPQL